METTNAVGQEGGGGVSANTIRPPTAIYGVPPYRTVKLPILSLSYSLYAHTQHPHAFAQECRERATRITTQ